MPNTLSATPATAGALSATAAVTFGGLFPPFYPGATTYPGRGTNLSASEAVPSTLTASEA